MEIFKVGLERDLGQQMTLIQKREGDVFRG